MKTWIAFAILLSLSVLSFIFIAPEGSARIPHAIFYYLLAINTFFSIRFFNAEILPPSAWQTIVDFVLILLYALLALTIGYSIIFAMLAAGLFLVAALKYALEVPFTVHPKTFIRKIKIDFLAMIPCVAAFFVAIAGFPVESAWLLAIVFALGNLYWLFINPMYKH